MDHRSNDEMSFELDLSDDEVDYELDHMMDLFVECCDVPISAHCCLDCHDAHDNGRTSLTIMEKLGRTPIETFLCCTHRRYWHELSRGQRIEILNETESIGYPARGVMLNEELVRNILLAIEAAIHEQDDPSQALVNLYVPGYGRQTVSDQIQILNGNFLEANKVPPADGDYWYPKRMTLKGWQFLNAVGDAYAWKLTKDALVRSAITEGKRQTEKRLALLLELSIMYANQTGEIELR